MLIAIKNAYLKDNILHYDNYFLSYRNKPLTTEAIERVVRLADKEAKVADNIDVVLILVGIIMLKLN